MNTDPKMQHYLKLPIPVIAEFGHRTAMVVSTLVRLSYYFRMKTGKYTFFHLAEDLAKAIGGISAGTVRKILQKLEEHGFIIILPGTQEKPKPTYRVQSNWENKIHSSKVVFAGKEDLERWGYPVALVAAHLEWLESYSNDTDNGIIRFETSKAAEKLYLSEQTVQRAIRTLLKGGIIEELECRLKWHVRRFRFVPDNGRKRVMDGRKKAFGSKLPAHSTSKEDPWEESSGLVMEEEFPEPEMALADVETNNLDLPSSASAAALGPQMEPETANEEFLHLVEGNRQNESIHTGEVSIDKELAGSILEELALKTVQELLLACEDQLLGFFEDRLSTTSVPDEERDLMLESLVLSISLRTNPAAHSSSPAIRRMAHSLSFLLGRILESAYEAREQMLSQLKKGFFAREDLNPDEKVKHLKDAVSKINRIGVPVPVGSYRCVNPRVERDFITPEAAGWKSAAGHFRKHPESTVAAINRLLIKSGKVPPPPQEGFDRFRLTRSARDLSSLFRDLKKIEQESACNLDH